MVAAFDERRKVIVPLLNQLPGFKCLDPGGAFYVFPDITGTGMDARELQNKMLEKAGVATVAGTSFGIHGEGFIRFSYANSVENIREAVKRIAALLRRPRDRASSSSSPSNASMPTRVCGTSHDLTVR